MKAYLAGPQGGAFLKLFAGSGNAPLTAEELIKKLDKNKDGAVSLSEVQDSVGVCGAEYQSASPLARVLGALGSEEVRTPILCAALAMAAVHLSLSLRRGK